MWWTGTIGNWNCVPAAGLAAGALAIYEDDTTGTAKKILPLIIDNVQGHCLNISIDGTTPETPDYWYFHSMSLSLSLYLHLYVYSSCL